MHISSNIQSNKIIRYLCTADTQAILKTFLENTSDWKRGQITNLKQPGLMVAISSHVHRLPFYCNAFIPPWPASSPKSEKHPAVCSHGEQLPARSPQGITIPSSTVSSAQPSVYGWAVERWHCLWSRPAACLVMGQGESKWGRSDWFVSPTQHTGMKEFFGKLCATQACYGGLREVCCLLDAS